LATQNKNINPVVVGVVGAAVGAAAVALSTKENRQKIGQTVKNVRDRGEKYYSDIRTKINKARDNANKQTDGPTKQGEKGGKEQSRASES
jgi:hypothetical protein